jgi:ferritin
MLSKKVLESLNYQINREIYSAYLYVSMSSYANFIGLKGMANWFNVQVQEELAHAQIFYNYINDQSERAIMQNIEAPEINFTSPLDLFEKTLAHEKIVTALINNLVSISREEKDYTTENFLAWFLKEQVEEESNANDLITKLKFIKDDGRGLLMLDTELAQRVFVPPTILQQA